MTQLGDSLNEKHRLAGLVFAGAALLAVGVAMLQFLEPKQYERFVGAALIQSMLYALTVWLVVRGRWNSTALRIILAVAVLARIIALLAPDTLSDDIYRYVWDGRVQAAGINPYRYVPADPALAFLRDNKIYLHINRADYAPTIYPPVAQMIFFLVSRIQESVTAMKLAMMGFEAVTIGAILAWLRRDGLPPERVLIYAWHPLPIWEFSGAGHIDAAAIAFLCLAVLAALRERPVAAGTALALGALVKPFALVIAPALWRKREYRMPAACAGVLLACYAPYLGVGLRVSGFLGGYGDEEGYLEGGGFFLTTLLRHLSVPVPAGALSASVVVAILLGLAMFVALRPHQESGRGLDPFAARDGISRAGLPAFCLVFRLGVAAALPQALSAPALPDAGLFHPVFARGQRLGGLRGGRLRTNNRQFQGGLVALWRVCDPRARRWTDARPATNGPAGRMSAQGGIRRRR